MGRFSMVSWDLNTMLKGQMALLSRLPKVFEMKGQSYPDHFGNNSVLYNMNIEKSVQVIQICLQYYNIYLSFCKCVFSTVHKM